MKRIYLISLIIVGSLIIGTFGYQAYASTGWFSPQATILKALSEFTGIPQEDLENAMETFGIARGIIPAAILTTVADVSLEEACTMVKDRSIRDYIAQNGISDAFRSQIAAFRDYLKEHYGKSLRFKLWFNKRLNTERRELIAALSRFTGIPKETLVNLAVKGQLGERVVLLAVAHKVTGEPIEELKALMAEHKLMDHLREEGKLKQFRAELGKFWRGVVHHITTRHRPFSVTLLSGALSKELGGKPEDYLKVFREYKDISPMRITIAVVVSHLTDTSISQVLSMSRSEIHTLLTDRDKLEDFRSIMQKIMLDIHRVLTHR